MAPEEKSSDGVRFQFLQNQIVRVRENDILAVIGKLGGGCSGSSLVSIDPVNGRNKATITILESIKDYVVGEEFPYSSGTPRRATPALKAYISGKSLRSPGYFICTVLQIFSNSSKDLVIYNYHS